MGTGSTLFMMTRLALSLAVVIGLMWAAAAVLRKRGFTGTGNRRSAPNLNVELLARKPLGRSASIAVVRVGERSIVVGVTDHQVTKLDDADLSEIDLDDGTNWTVSTGPTGPASAWKMMLEQMRNKTVRR